MTEQATAPIPLNAAQEQAAKEWAADDRLWTTQETVEFNLRTFARKILAEQADAAALALQARQEPQDANTQPYFRCSICEGNCGPNRPRSYCVLCELELIASAATFHHVEPWIAEVLVHARAQLLEARAKLNAAGAALQARAREQEELKAKIARYENAQCITCGKALDGDC